MSGQSELLFSDYIVFIDESGELPEQIVEEAE